MKTIVATLLLVATSAISAVGQIKVGTLRRSDFADQKGSFVVGYITCYLSKNDLNADKNAVCLEYSRQYDRTGADSMFARMNLNGADMPFKASKDKRYAYISLNGKYRLKKLPSAGKSTITIYYGKNSRIISVFAKSNSG